MAFGVNDIVAHIGVFGDKAFIGKMKAMDAQVLQSSAKMNQMLTAVSLIGVALGATAVIAAAKFEKEMANVNTLLEGSTKAFDKLNTGVLEIASSTPVAIGSLTKGLYDLVSAGAPAGKELVALKSAAMAASAGLTSVETAVNAGMSVVNAYGGDISELNDIYDIQFATVKKGVLTYEQLASSLGAVLPAAASLKIPFKEVAGTLAHITKSGIGAQQASTFLARAFDSMTEHADKWKEAGVNLYDKGEFRGMLDIMGDLNKSLSGLSTETRDLTLRNLKLNTRSSKAIKSITNNWAGYKKTLTAVSDSTKEMQKAFDKQNSTLAAQATIIKNQLHVAFVEMGNEVLPMLKSLTSLFAKHPGLLKSILKTIAAILVPVGLLIGVWKTWTAVNAALIGLKMAGYFAGLKAAVVSLGASFGLFLIAITAIYTAVKLVNDAMNVWGESLDQLHDSIELTNKVQMQAETLMKNAVTNLEELRKKGGDELVKYNGKWITVKEAIIKTEAQLKAYSNSSGKIIPAVAIDFDRAAFKAKKLADNNKLLSDAGIKTTKSVKDLIAKYEKMLPLAKGDALATKGLTDKITELKTEIDPTAKEVQNYMDKFEAGNKILPEIRTEMEKVTVKMEEQKIKTDNLVQSQEELEAIQKKVNKEMTDGVYAFGEISEAIGLTSESLDGLLSATQNLIDGDVVGSVVTIVSAALKNWKKTSDKIHKDLEKKRLSFESYIMALNDVGGAWVNLAGVGKKEWGKLSGYMNEFGIISESSIRAQISKLFELMGHLKKNSYEWGQAKEKIESLYEILGITDSWEQLTDLMERAKDKLNHLIGDGFVKATNDIKNFGEGLDSLNGDIELIGGMFDNLTESLETVVFKWSLMESALFGNRNTFESNSKAISKAINEMLYFNLDPSKTTIDEQILSAINAQRAYLGQLNPNSQAYKDAIKSLEALRDEWDKLGTGITIEITPILKDVDKFGNELPKIQLPVTKTVTVKTKTSEAELALERVKLSMSEIKDKTVIVSVRYKTLNQPSGEIYGSYREPSSANSYQRKESPAINNINVTPPTVIINDPSPITTVSFVDDIAQPRIEQNQNYQKKIGIYD